MRPAEYRERGYTVARGLLSPAEVDALRGEAASVFAAQLRRRGLLAHEPADGPQLEAAMYRFFAADLQGFVACGQQVQLGLALNRLGVDDRIIGALKSLGLERPVVCTRPLVLWSSRHLATRAAYWRLPVHQDWRNMQGSLDSVVAWLPLVDVDRELGALEVLPGSHTWGLIDAAVEDGYPEIRGYDDAPFVACELERGDVLLFSAFLLHRSGLNATERIRWSCQLRFNNLAEPSFLARGFPTGYVYKPKAELLTPGFPSRQELERFFG